MILNRTGISMLGACGLTIASALAADEVVVEDGSRLVGTVEALDEDGLRVDTAHMGGVTVDWAAVLELRGAAELAVELTSGELLIGTLTADAEHLTVAGETTRRVERGAVARILSPEAAMRPFSAAVDLGMGIIRGNREVFQLSLGAALGYETRKYEAQLHASSIVNQRSDADDTQRSALDLSFHRTPKRWRLGGFASFEQDEGRGLDLRGLVGVSAGRRLLDSKKRRLDLLVGVDLAREEFEGVETRENLEGFLAVDFRWKRKRKIELVTSLSLFPKLDDVSSFRGQLNGILSFKYMKALSISLRAFDRYDNDPPIAREKNDYGMTLGLGWTP